MTLRIERVSTQTDCLAEIQAQIEGAKPRPFEEVTLVDVGAVRFLSACEHRGIELLHCAPYIRHRIVSEGSGQGDQDEGQVRRTR